MRMFPHNNTTTFSNVCSAGDIHLSIPRYTNETELHDELHEVFAHARSAKYFLISNKASNS